MSLARHPTLVVAAWTPRDEDAGVLWCCECGSLWLRRHDRYMDDTLCEALPAKLLGLLGASATLEQLVEGLSTADSGQGVQRLLAYAPRLIKEAPFDPPTTVQKILSGLADPGIDLVRMRDLVSILDVVTARVAEELLPPSPPEPARGPLDPAALAASFLQSLSNVEGRDDVIARSSSPRGEATAESVRIRVARWCDTADVLTNLLRPGAGDTSHHARLRVEMRACFERVYIRALVPELRAHLLFLPDADWDAFEAALHRGQRVEGLMRAVEHEGRNPTLDSPQRLWEAGAELRYLTGDACPAAFPHRLRCPSDDGQGLTAGQVASLLRAVELLGAMRDLAPDLAPAAGHALFEIHGLLQRERDAARLPGAP